MVTIELSKNSLKKFPNDLPSVIVTFTEFDDHFVMWDNGKKITWMPRHWEILKILDLMFQFEDLKYPPDRGYLGRKMLYDEITRVFEKRAKL